MTSPRLITKQTGGTEYVVPPPSIISALWDGHTIVGYPVYQVDTPLECALLALGFAQEQQSFTLEGRSDILQNDPHVDVALWRSVAKTLCSWGIGTAERKMLQQWRYQLHEIEQQLVLVGMSLYRAFLKIPFACVG